MPGEQLGMEGKGVVRLGAPINTNNNQPTITVRNNTGVTVSSNNR